MNYTTIALALLWLFTMISHTRTHKDRKRLRKSLSELYSEYRERLKCHEAEKQGMKDGFDVRLEEELKEMEAKLNEAIVGLNEKREEENKTIGSLERNNTHLFAQLRKLMYGHVYKCSTCGRFIGVGNANWDMDTMKPYCDKHLKQTTPYRCPE